MFKEETLSEKFIKKGFWLYFFSFLIAPSGYIIKLIVSNDLSVEEVGVLYSIIGLISLLSNYNDLGFSESLNYFLPKFWLNKEHNNFKTSIFLALFFQTITAFVIAILLWLFSGWLGENYFHSEKAVIILKIFTIFFVIYNIFNVLVNIFKAFQDTFHEKIVEFIRMWSIVLLSVILFFLDKGNILTYSISRLFGTLLATIGGLFFFFKNYKFVIEKGKVVFDFKLFKKIFSYAIWVVIAIQGGILLSSIDQQMVIYFLGPKEAGYYTNFLSLLNSYSLIIGPIFSFLFPVTTELATRKQYWKLDLMLSIFYKYFSVFGLILGTFLAITGPFISYVLFGEKFIPSGELLRFGAGFVFINILISINFSVLAGLGKIKERVKILWIAAVINFIGNFFTIRYLGLKGAILTTVLCWILMLLLSYQEIIKSGIKIKFDIKFLIKNFLGLTIYGIILYFLIKDLNFEIARLKLFFILFLYGVGMLIFFIIFNLKETFLFIKEIRKIIVKNN